MHSIIVVNILNSNLPLNNGDIFYLDQNMQFNSQNEAYLIIMFDDVNLFSFVRSSIEK